MFGGWEGEPIVNMQYSDNYLGWIRFSKKLIIISYMVRMFMV